MKANIEVIVAAGAVHTPQLFQLSGIGPQAILKGLEISVVEDFPGARSNF